MFAMGLGGKGVKLTTYLYLVPRTIMMALYLLPSPYAFMAYLRIT
jgi:hypothetical protein